MTQPSELHPVLAVDDGFAPSGGAQTCPYLNITSPTSALYILGAQGAEGSG